MKHIYTLVLFTLMSTVTFSQVQNVTFEITPEFFDATDEITVTVSDIDVNLWGVSDIYLWAWYYDLNDDFVGDSPTNGAWTDSSESQKFTNNGDGTFSYTFVPSTLYGTTEVGRLGMLAKAKDGSGDKKTQDNLVEVGTFQTSLISPTQQTTIVNSGETLAIEGTSSVSSDFELFENGTSINTANNTTTYNFNPVITDSSVFELVITNPATSEQRTFEFSAITSPDVEEQAVPAGMVNGINFDPDNPEEMTLVLYAPNKSFVHLVGNFPGGSWSLDNNNVLKKDSAQDKFWITLQGLDPAGQDVIFQYSIDATVRVADPYSTQVLSEFNDPFIEESTFPNIPEYPVGQTSELISWINTGEEVYVWENTDFERPAQEDLVIYELLIRDFDENHSFDSVVARLDYLEDLGINAIELMPVNEFDGNLSWGYNPSFHMALDKYYGTRNAFKAFVDECHNRGIAVILDVVYNHGTGQHPYYRMYNDCDGCYNGTPTADNPLFNAEDPNTAFQFFNDINHESPDTQEWLDRMNAYWLEEYRIDGYRFDFTKGFTNMSGDGGAYDASRIALLERMYDELRAVDPTAYVILEHFAPNEEETELINYRATTDTDEPGMMVWGNHNFNYNEATMGYNGGSDFSWISYLNRGWNTPSNVSYMESHDEERLNFKNQEFGNSSGDYNVQELSTALDRLELAGAFYFTVPGPKMIWQFGELGYDFSINYCEDGTIDGGCRVDPKPIAWNLGYDTEQDRLDVYDTYEQLIALKLGEPIFSTDTFTMDVGSDTGLKRIQLEDPSATGTEIRFVTILGNFDVIEREITPSFQEVGTWYNMLTGETQEVSDVDAPIVLQPGQYMILSNEETLLSVDEETLLGVVLYPNPSSESVRLNISAETVTIYDITGKLVHTKNQYDQNEDINISFLKTGFYIVKAGSQSFKLIKN